MNTATMTTEQISKAIANRQRLLFANLRSDGRRMTPKDRAEYTARVQELVTERNARQGK